MVSMQALAKMLLDILKLKVFFILRYKNVFNGKLENLVQKDVAITT